MYVSVCMRGSERIYQSILVIVKILITLTILVIVRITSQF